MEGHWTIVLGILDPKLETIEAGKFDIKDHLTEMLRLWLNKAYDLEGNIVSGAIMAETERS